VKRIPIFLAFSGQKRRKRIFVQGLVGLADELMQVDLNRSKAMQVEVEFFLCCDMRSWQALASTQSGTTKYKCLWCLVECSFGDFNQVGFEYLRTASNLLGEETRKLFGVAFNLKPNVNITAAVWTQRARRSY
jgi:hypothetical protein